MSISQKDIKLLWGRAASRCAFANCKTLLTQDSQATSIGFPIGEQAHIVAKEVDGPRGHSCLSPDSRDSYDNLILLCPTHHTIIDKNPEDFSVNKLHDLKRDHESWVEETLSQKSDLNQQARDLIYISLIDSVVEFCHLYEWKNWTFNSLEPIPRWTEELLNDFSKFHLKLLTTDFPGTLIELERSIKTLSILLYKSAQVFEKHCEMKEDNNGNIFYRGIQFYKISEWDQEKYHKLLENFEEWIEECHQCIFDATKAANWFREVVRRDINPIFFAKEGKFVATYPWSTGGGLSHQFLLLEYTQEEKDCLLATLDK
jgi:hypothetical protein